eukprot:725019-Rhodomonas_salina.1
MLTSILQSVPWTPVSRCTRFTIRHAFNNRPKHTRGALAAFQCPRPLWRPCPGRTGLTLPPLGAVKVPNAIAIRKRAASCIGKRVITTHPRHETIAKRANRTNRTHKVVHVIVLPRCAQWNTQWLAIVDKQLIVGNTLTITNTDAPRPCSGKVHACNRTLQGLAVRICRALDTNTSRRVVVLPFRA